MPTLRLLPELEEALRQIPGVRAASVVTGPDAHPTEVHVLASPGKPPKQVVRDVQSLAMAQYDLEIDHRIVSVVQIGEGEPGLPLAEEIADLEHPGTGPRPKIASIMVRTSDGHTDASVTLSAGQDVFEGKAVGPAGTSHRPRLVAAATLDALDDLLGQSCEIESATIVHTDARDVALSVLTLAVPRLGEQVLTGAAVVRGDDAEAIARSVLAALNRHLAG